MSTGAHMSVCVTHKRTGIRLASELAAFSAEQNGIMSSKL